MERTRIEAPVAIVGGGIVGCATAYYLAQRGVQAVVLERSTFGTQASGRNGGGVRAQCRERPERILAMHSIELWEGLEAELGVDVEYAQDGNIRMAMTEERMAQLEAEAQSEWEDGLPVELWDRDTLRRRAPYLSPVFIGAKYCPIDGIANPLLVTPALAWAAGRMGAHMLPHSEVRHVHVAQGQVTGLTAHTRQGELHVETPLIVHAAGPWTTALGQELGLAIPVQPKRTVIAVTRPMPFLFKEFVSAHDLQVYARPARKGHVHIGGVSVHDRTFDQGTPTDGLEHLARGVRMIPALAHARFLRSWAGTLAMTPDTLPIIGPVDGIQGYVLATGFSGHGFCLGPIVGKLLSELILDGESSLPLEPFRLSRFPAQ